MNFSIFEIKSTPIPVDDREEFLPDWAESHVGYYDAVLDEDSREDEIEYLMKTLPAGFFEREGDKLTLVKDPLPFAEECAKVIREIANKITGASLTKYFDTDLYNLTGAITCGHEFLCTMILNDGECDPVDYWVCKLKGYWDNGNRDFYIGGVINCHV